MVWNEIDDALSVNNLMNKFGGFYDSCMKELKYFSGAFVDSNLSMSPINNSRTVKMIFQRQYNNPIAIEIEFIGTVKLCLNPVDDNFTCEIQGASMFICNNRIYWYDSDSINEPVCNYDGTWLCANRARWRIADEYIGKDEVY